MLARIRAKREMPSVDVPLRKNQVPASRPQTTLEELLSVGWKKPKAGPTVAERLERARSERQCAVPADPLNSDLPQQKGAR